MTETNIIEETSRYYRARAVWHDDYWIIKDYNHTVNLLAPIVKPVQTAMAGKDVLEIACGTGLWTQVIAHTANSVVATDVADTMLELARAKSTELNNITYIEADAYSLSNISGKFNAAFASDWWSHIPLSKIEHFLTILHSRLQSGALIIFIDLLPDDELVGMRPRFDEEGNRIGTRTLPDGNEYDVIKNFQTKDDLYAVLKPHSKSIDYLEYAELKRWMVKYTLK